MRTTTSLLFLTLSLFTAGCETVTAPTVLLRDASLSLPELNDTQITNAGLQAVKDNVYIAFLGDCPVTAMAILPQCEVPLSNAICRQENKIVQFKPIKDPNNPNPSFGIEFETEPGFNPCTQTNLDSQTPGPKTCTISSKSSWPGGGAADLIIKYTVTTPAGGNCDLDPYLVLRR